MAIEKKPEGSVAGRVVENLELRDAIRMAIENPEFARKLVSNPEQYRSAFNLKDEHIAVIKNIKVEDFAELAQRSPDPQTFADTAAAVEAFLRTGVVNHHYAAYGDQQPSDSPIPMWGKEAKAAADITPTTDVVN